MSFLSDWAMPGLVGAELLGGFVAFWYLQGRRGGEKEGQSENTLQALAGEIREVVGEMKELNARLWQHDKDDTKFHSDTNAAMTNLVEASKVALQVATEVARHDVRIEYIEKQIEWGTRRINELFAVRGSGPNLPAPSPPDRQRERRAPRV